jgi:type IV secretion system protein VirB5
MEQLLSGTSRNYLPSSWMQLASASQGAGAYPGLASDVRSAISANAVLSPGQLATFSAADQQQILAARQMVALRQALAQEALANTSNRFAAIQTLIAAIGAAGDQKAILDLQTRTSAELGMLQNEQTKLQVLTEASRAQESSNFQRERELAIAGQGRFDSRFQPAP